MPAWDQDPIVEPSAQPGTKRPAWEGAPIVKPPASVSAPKSGYLMGLRDPVDALAQIAENLKLSPSTVGTHLYHIKQKLNVNNAAELALVALRNGMIDV